MMSYLKKKKKKVCGDKDTNLERFMLQVTILWICDCFVKIACFQQKLCEREFKILGECDLGKDPMLPSLAMKGISKDVSTGSDGYIVYGEQVLRANSHSPLQGQPWNVVASGQHWGKCSASREGAPLWGGTSCVLGGQLPISLTPFPLMEDFTKTPQ